MGTKQIAGTGQMAEATRSHRRAETWLGAIDAWSEVLLGSLNLMFSCKFQCVVFRGFKMIQFCSDDYLP